MSNVIMTAQEYLAGLKEDQEQATFVQFLEQKGELFYHVPNGGFRHPREGVKLKKQGVKAGVPDICICAMRKGFGGLYIEFKRRKKSIVSERQKEWIENLRQAGYKAEIAAGYDEAVKIYTSYIQD